MVNLKRGSPPRKKILTFSGFKQQTKHFQEQSFSLALASFFLKILQYTGKTMNFQNTFSFAVSSAKSRFTVTAIGVQYIFSNTARTIFTRSAFAWRLKEIIKIIFQLQQIGPSYIYNQQILTPGLWWWKVSFARKCLVALYLSVANNSHRWRPLDSGYAAKFNE